MENDSIRASGNDTLVDIWISGKLRAICITREAIDAYVGLDRAARLTEDERCDFVRTHLPLVVTAVKSRLREAGPAAHSVTIDAGELAGTGDRRTGERRKADRRKTSKAKDVLPQGERRLGDRRKRDRRRPASKRG
jgi:hypothetical protein